jgi:beta-phosphoglucomutase
MFENEIKLYTEMHGFKALNPKAVLFDMDGVLFNSMPNHAVSWHKSMTSFGLVMPPADAYKYEGMRGVDTIKLLARQQWQRELTDDEAQKMYAVKSKLFSSCPPAKKMEGVEELMHKIKDCGLKICVVTGSGQKSLLGKLEKSFPGLISASLMVTSFDVKHGKPHPEPYIMGLKKAEVNPNEAIVVENAPLGVRSAVAADIFTVAVNTGPLPDKMLANEGANIIFKRMTDFRDHWDDFAANFCK